MIGTSSDRIGTPSGQSFYLTVSKSLRRETGRPIAPYVGVVYGAFQDRFLPVGGINIQLAKISPRPSRTTASTSTRS